jgi:small-conductance mechanosensitive channel
MTSTFEKIIDTIANQAVTWAAQFVDMLPRLIVAILIIILFNLLSRLARKATDVVMKRVTTNDSLVRLTCTLVFITVTTIGIFIALSILQLEKTVTSLLAGVGVIGLALGFAFQETAANFMSGVFLAVKRPYAIGEVVKVGDAFGTVKGMDLRTTIIESWQGQDIIIPNKELFQGRIINYSTNNKRRIDLVVGVSYGDDLEKAVHITKKAVEEVEYRHPDFPVDVFMTDFGSSSINMVVHLWIKYDHQAPYFQAQDQAARNIKRAYAQNDITIPFPIRTLDFGIKGGQKLDAMLKERAD